MVGEMVFRKDCGDCGRSFFTPDRRAKLCPRCAETAQKKKLPSKGTKEAEWKGPSSPPKTEGTKSSGAPANDSKTGASIEGKTRRNPSELGRGKKQEVESREAPAAPAAALAKPELVLTKEQEQDVIDRYRAYVERMERPPNGRRKTIAAETGIPFRVVVLAVRNWRSAQPEARDLTREERFSVERSYFRQLRKRNSLSEIKERISQETGFSLWQISRSLDLLHEGEDRLQEIPDPSPEQKAAILAEYDAYLSSSAPPEPPLHALIAGKVAVTPKQVHKVLLAFRLGHLREKLKGA